MPIDLPDPVTLAIPAFVLLIIAEMVYGRLTGRTRYEPRDTATSLTMGFGSQVAGALTGGLAFAIGYWAWENYRLFDFGWSWWVFLLAFLMDDLAYYVFHRLAHRVRWMWAAHIIHHSSQHYNLSTALRQTWTGFFALSFVFHLPLFILGFHPLMIVFVNGINLVYQFWIHTEAIDRFPRWIEAIFNTPSHHRVHHATNPKYLDSNYAGALIIWDRMFGTFVPEDKSEPCRYGIVRQLGTFNPIKVAFHEWLGIFSDLWHARSWRERWGYIAGPPGWSPDGSRITTDKLKQDWAERRRRLMAEDDETTGDLAARTPAE